MDETSPQNPPSIAVSPETSAAVINQPAPIEVSQSVPPASPPPPPPLEQPKQKMRLPLLPIVIVFIVLMLLIGGVFALTHAKKIVPKVAVSTKQTQPLTLQSGKLSIGIDATYPPMESVDTNGRLIGYDIDLGNTIAHQLGVNAQFQPTPFDSIFDALNRKQFDVIISSVTITDQRKQQYDFSDPYLNAGEVIITKKDNTSIKLPKDLANKRVGVQTNTQEVIQAGKYTTHNLVIVYSDNAPAITDLVGGKLDAVLTDLPNAKGIIVSNPQLKIASDPFTSEYYGIVFRKGETLLEQKINTILENLNKQGYFADLKHKWLE